MTTAVAGPSLPAVSRTSLATRPAYQGCELLHVVFAALPILDRRRQVDTH
jgi:hypothetical protein